MKAQLLKTTLYICDLEDSLSWSEIENLIKYRALNGVATNCVCHFADSQIGKKVEWDDDIDLNQCNCPTSTWEKYFVPPKNPMTNADLIRARNDHELADMISSFICDINEGVEYSDNPNRWLEWLQRPAEVE